MEIKHKTISDEVVSKFNAEEFVSDYPYIIKNRETGETIIGTLCEGNYEYFSLTFNIFNEAGEMSEFSINVNEANKYEFMKPITCENLLMKDSLEETEDVPDEISDEEKDESKSDKNIDSGIDPDKMSRLVDNLSKLGCSLIDSVDKDDPDGSNVNSLAKRFGTVLTRTIDYNKKETVISDNTNLDDINKLFGALGDEISDYVSIKRFYYKRTYVKNETEDTDTISILIPHPLFMNLPYEMIKSLGYKVHPMFIDKDGYVRDEIYIGKTITKLGEKDLSDSITMYMASGLQMLYFIERGLKRTSPDFHGIRALYGGYTVKISDAYFDKDNCLIIGGRNTHVKAHDERGFVTRFKQYNDFRSCLFIPENCDENDEKLCDSYYCYPFKDENDSLLLGGRWAGRSNVGAFYWHCHNTSSYASANIGARLWYYM